MAVSRINEAGLNVNQYGNRNLIINGAMQVAQRGTSFTAVTNGTFTLDRFNYRESSDGAVTVTQDSSGPDGFANSLKLDVTTADTSISAVQYSILEYNVEAQDLQRLAFGTSSAKNFTLSFYVKSNKTGTYALNISLPDNSSKQATLNYTINSANTWERKSLTFNGDTSGVINDDNGNGMVIYWWLAVGSTYTGGSTSASFQTFANADHAAGQAVNILDSTSNDWYLTGVQLEVGDTATDFEHRTFGDELLRCQRYYYRKGGDPDGNYAPAAIAYLTSAIQLSVAHPVQMRANPSVSVDGNIRAVDGQTSHVSSGASITNISQKDTLAWYTGGGHSGMTQYRMYIINGQTSANYMEVDAEL